MEELIEEYLFIQGYCPLPSIGSLQVVSGNAVAWHGDNKLSAPSPVIEFTKKEIPAEAFIAFVSKRKNISIGEASLILQKYCTDLGKLNSYLEMKLENSGRFFVSKSGILEFKQEPVLKELLPPVSIKRVVHSKTSSHRLRVGDKDTTNEVMTEYYSDKPAQRRQNWWIGALLVLAAVITGLYFYFQTHSFSENFGNTQQTEIKPDVKTYETK
jgi:hypothetical protein